MEDYLRSVSLAGLVERNLARIGSNTTPARAAETAAPT